MGGKERKGQQRPGRGRHLSSSARAVSHSSNCRRGGCRSEPREPGTAGAPRVPAVHHDGAAEEVAESVHSPPQLEEQVRVLRHPVVRPAGELDLSHLPSGGLFSFLVKRAYFHGGHFFSRTDAPRWEDVFLPGG